MSKDLQYKDDGGKQDQEIISQVEKLIQACTEAMNDDFNTAVTIGHLFNILKKINSLHSGQLLYTNLGKDIYKKMVQTFQVFITHILGLKEELPEDPKVMIETIVKLYHEAKQMRDYEKVDQIRNDLKQNGIILKDLKHGVEWAYEE